MTRLAAGARWTARFPIDSSGTLPDGRSFKTPAEMKTILTAQLPEFSHCLIEKMMTYALGRGLERYDRKTVEGINERLATAGYPFQTLIQEVVQSLPFQSRRGEVVISQNIRTPHNDDHAQSAR